MYGKIFESMYDGTLVENWEALVTFQQMIVLSDSSGHVDVTPRSIASRTGIPLEIIERGIQVLESPDPESRTPDQDGRRIVRLDEHRSWGWKIVNHEKYRQLHNSQQKREKAAQRQREKRSRDKRDEGVTGRDGDEQGVTQRDSHVFVFVSEEDSSTARATETDSDSSSKSASERPSSSAKKKQPKSKPKPPAGQLTAEEILAQAEIPDPLCTEEFGEAWESWVRHKQETPHAWKSIKGPRAQLSRLAKHSVDGCIAGIHEAISRDWQGIFPERIVSDRKPSQTNRESHDTRDQRPTTGSWR